MNDVIKHKIKHNAHRTLVSIKWVIFAILVGGIVGLCGTAFYFCLTFVTVLRGQCNGGDHGYPFATNFNPEINIREVSANGSYWVRYGFLC